MEGKKYRLFFVFFIIILGGILFTGCGGDEEEPDCSGVGEEWEIHEWDEEAEECVLVSTEVPEACSNLDEDELTFCNCPEFVEQDVPIEEGGCSGEVGDYLEYTCNISNEEGYDDDECVLEMNENVESESRITEAHEGTYLIELRTSFNQPFIADRDTVTVRADLRDIDEELVRDLKISRAILESADGEYFGEKDVEEEFSGHGDRIEFEVPFNEYTLTYFHEEYNTLMLRLNLEYMGLDGEEYSRVTEDIRETLIAPFDVIEPDNKGEEDDEGDGFQW